MAKKCEKERDNAEGTVTCGEPLVNIFGNFCMLHSHSKGNPPFCQWILVKDFFLNGTKMRKRNGWCRGHIHMQGTPGEYFGNCLNFAQPLKRQPPLSTSEFLSKIFFLNGEKMRKRKGQCRGHTHMRGTPGEYFWNCLNFAQPLKRQPPLSTGEFLSTFFF